MPNDRRNTRLEYNYPNKNLYFKMKLNKNSVDRMIQVAEKYMEKQIFKALQGTAKKWSEVLELFLEENTPKVTGRMSQSWKIKATKVYKKSTRLYAVDLQFMNGMFYSLFVEYGHGTYAPKNIINQSINEFSADDIADMFIEAWNEIAV
jgi:hypothetical protein